MIPQGVVILGLVVLAFSGGFLAGAAWGAGVAYRRGLAAGWHAALRITSPMAHRTAAGRIARNAGSVDEWLTQRAIDRPPAEPWSGRFG